MLWYVMDKNTSVHIKKGQSFLRIHTADLTPSERYNSWSKVFGQNRLYPDQTTPERAVWSGSTVVVLSASFGHNTVWAASSEFGTYRLCQQQRFRQACASAQSRQNLRCSLIQAVNQEEPSDRKPDPWPLWMAGHAQLKFITTECSKTQIRLTRSIW